MASRSLAHRRTRPIALPSSIVKTFKALPGASNDDCIIDCGIAPIGSDTEGNLHRLIAALGLIDPTRPSGRACLRRAEQLHRTRRPARMSEGKP